MIIKAGDYSILMRGYELDREKLKSLGEAYNGKLEALTKCEQETEHFKNQCGEDNLGDAWQEQYKKSYELLREEGRNAYADVISYTEGSFFKSVEEVYKNSKRTRFEIARAFAQAEGEIPLPQSRVEEGEELFDFSDCNTEEDVFKWTVNHCLEIMSGIISLPPVKVTTRFPDKYLISIDNGTREPFKLGTTIEVGEELSVSLEREGCPEMKRIFQNSGTEVLNYSPYDLDILTICNGLLDAGNDYVPIETIARAMRGGKNGNISDKTTEEISDSLKRLMCPITLLYYSEKKNYKWENVSGRYVGPMLPVEIITAEVNGKVVANCVHFLEKPILFRLAEMKMQVVFLPASAIAINGYQNKRVRELSVYLYERVAMMYPAKDGKPKSPSLRTILVDTLLKETIEDEKKRKNGKIKKKQMDKTIEILTQYKEDGIIYGFSFNLDREANEKKQKFIIAMDEKQEREMWKAEGIRTTLTTKKKRESSKKA